MRPLHRISLAGWLAAVALAWSAPGWALTIAPGSDTLFTQIEISDTVVLARFQSSGPDGLRFAADEVLRGTAGAEILIRDAEGVAVSRLKPDQRLLLMLNRAEDGSFQLALEDFSLLRVAEAELADTLGAARTWLRERENREQSRAALVSFASARSPFVQHSALMGLMNLGLMDRGALKPLMAELASGRILAPEDRQLIVRFAGALGATEHQAFLVERVRDAAEASELREAALFALDAIDSDAVRSLTSDVERSGTPQLRELMRSLEN